MAWASSGREFLEAKSEGQRSPVGVEGDRSERSESNHGVGGQGGAGDGTY